METVAAAPAAGTCDMSSAHHQCGMDSKAPPCSTTLAVAVPRSTRDFRGLRPPPWRSPWLRSAVVSEPVGERPGHTGR